jgi:hypothetical protein
MMATGQRFRESYREVPLYSDKQNFNALNQRFNVGAGLSPDRLNRFLSWRES